LNKPSNEGRVWDALSVYESTELVRRLCHEKTGRRPTATKAREIVSYFAQGREYFRNAAGASELVRPLILYYGVMSLFRGLILFLDISKSKVAGGHGLGADGWEDLNTKPEAMPTLPIAVHSNGTFPELCRVTKNIERLRIPMEGSSNTIGALSPGTSSLSSDAPIKLKEALGQIPDLQDTYESTFAEHPSRLPCEARAIFDPYGKEKVGAA
jgi:hypothetical protein